MLELISEVRCFEGNQRRYKHWSDANQCTMTFSAFVPDAASEENPMPVVYWLSGLTCTDENFVLKAGAQRYASELGLIIVSPDTSPRGDDVPDDAEGTYDFGLGAGFYLNATESPWDKHYKMYSYIVEELTDTIENNLPVTAKASITGHSMGGHGALTIALKNSEYFSSVSAFCPIVNPTECPWGNKAFTHYLGADNTEVWNQYDTCELIKANGLSIPMLVDQGSSDNFLQEQLLTSRLITTLEACDISESDLCRIRMQDGFDHSYFFISTFIGEHLTFHSQHLKD